MALAPVALLLGLAEAAAWGLEPLLWGTSYPGGQPRGLYLSSNPDDRPQLRPGAELKGLLVDVRVNSWGFRDDEVLEPAPEDALRLWVVGGSTTFDIYARDNASAWPNLLEQRLQAALPERRVEVLNAGIPGETYAGSITDLRAWGPRFQPDIVVLYHGPNDLRFEAQQALLSQGPPPPPGGLGWLVSGFALPRFFARVSAPSVFTGEGGFLPQRHLRSAERGLREALRLTRELHAQPLLVTHPHRVVRDEQGQLDLEMHELAQLLSMPPDQAVLAFEGYNDLVRETARRERIPLAEAALAVDSSPENWGDLTHFRRPGAEACAGAVAETVLASPELLRAR